MNRSDFTITIRWRMLRLMGIIGLSIFLTFGCLAYAYGQAIQTTVGATVVGWFKTEQIDNSNLSLATNMNVWVNGRQFVICTSPAQPLSAAMTPEY